MPESKIAELIGLPNLKLIHCGSGGLWLYEKASDSEVCPKCATLSRSCYDKRWVTLRDSPIRGFHITLKILKRRFFCKKCLKPFTEPIPGVIPKRRTTQRFRAEVMQACSKYSDLKSVCRDFKVSADFVYSSYYEQLKLRRSMVEDAPWPSAIGIDEHSYSKNKASGYTQFVSVIVNQNKGKIFDVVIGKTQAEMEQSLKHIQGRENVLWATIDMCDPYKNFIRNFFPNSKIIADKFHVLRLLTPALFKERKNIVGKKADRRAKKLLLMSSHKLNWNARRTLTDYLQQHPKLYELYYFKEQLHKLYRTYGYYKAYKAFKNLMDEMSVSLLPEIRTLRATLLKWQEEILNYFIERRLTNARLEGFNNKASLLKRRAYGYRNHENYRLQLLNACS